MSESVFPAQIRGLTFTSLKRPGFDTIVQKSPDRVRVSIPRIMNPVWKWNLVYNYLYDNPENIATDLITTDLKTLMGFFLQRRGKNDDFLFTDPDDNHVEVGSLPLVTDGTKFYSPVQRVLGGFAEDVTDLNPDNTEDSITVFANAVEQPTGWTLKGQNGRGLAIPGYSFKGLYIEWDAEPTGPITATFDFYFRVRFDMDAAGFEKFINELWTLGGDQSKSGSSALVLISARAPDPPRAGSCIGGTPRIDSVDPPWIPDGGPDFTITITGVNFRPDSVVTWAGHERATAYINSTTLQVTILEGDIVDPGTFYLRVNNPPPGCGLSAKFPYVVKPVARFGTIGGAATGFGRFDEITYNFQPGDDPPEIESDVAILFEDAYRNSVYVIDSLLPAFLNNPDSFTYSPTYPLWEGMGVCGISPNGHMIAAAFQKVAGVGAPTFTGSGANDLKTGGLQDGTFGTDVDRTWTITIRVTGDRFDFDNGVFGGLNIPIVGGDTPQDLAGGVQISFSNSGGYTWGDKWTFKTYVPGVRVQVWDVGYHPTVDFQGFDTENGPSYFVIADLIKTFDYPKARLAETVSYPDFPNVEVTRATGSLTDGGKPDCDGTKTVVGATIRVPGTGFSVGDEPLIYGRDAKFHIDTINGFGGATSGHIAAPGTEYVTAINVPCTGGAGTGLILDIIGDYDENYNFGTNLTSCDCVQGITRAPIDLQVNNDGTFYLLDLEKRGGSLTAAVNTVATACEGTHGQVTFPAPAGVDGEISELTWDQVNLAKLDIASSTLEEKGSWLMRYRVASNANQEDIIDEPVHTSRIRFGALTVHSGHGGAGYAVNDLFNVDGGTTPATGRVLTVSSGAAVTVSIVQGGYGWGYVPNFNSFQSQDVTTTPTSGSGSGLKVDFTLGGPVHTTTRNSTEFRELLAAPRIWDGANSRIIAIANPDLDYEKFLTDPLRTSSVATSGMGIIAVNNGGTGFRKYETVSVAGVTGGTATIWEVDGSGTVLLIGVFAPGTGASIASGVGTSGGSGSGLTVDIVSLRDGNDGQITHNGGMSILEPTAITTLHYQDATDGTYFDKLLVGNWGMDLSYPVYIDNPDPSTIGSRPYQRPTFVVSESVASQPVNWQDYPVFPVVSWQWDGHSSWVARTPDHISVPYDRIDGSGATTAVKVMTDGGTINSVTDSNPSDHALAAGVDYSSVSNTILFNAVGWSVVSDCGPGVDFNGGYRLIPTFNRSTHAITIGDDLEPVSPVGLVSDELVTLSHYAAGGPMVATLRRPT